MFAPNSKIYSILKGVNPSVKNEIVEKYNLKSKTINWFAEDGYKMEAFFLPAEEINQHPPTIILLHGIRSDKFHFIPIAQKLNKWGYNAVCVDLRGHGNSEGTYTNFGYTEKEDIKRLVDFLMEENRITGSVGVWGQSLGGAVALQAMAHDKRIEFGIVESAFDTLMPTVRNYAKVYTGVDLDPLIPSFISSAERRLKIPFDKVIPADAAKHIEGPLLLVHGKLDKRIPVENAHNIYNSLSKSIDPQLKIIEDASHLNVWEKGAAEYLNQVRNFIHVNHWRIFHRNAVSENPQL